jgi:hypothetical protein
MGEDRQTKERKEEREKEQKNPGHRVAGFKECVHLRSTIK